MLARLRLFAAIALFAGPAVSQGDLDGIRDKLGNSTDWDELCEIVDCSQFPRGYHTHAIGPILYYFPSISIMTEKPPSFTGGVKPARFVEDVPEGRSFGFSSQVGVGDCCHYLLSFHGLADDFPEFPGIRPKNRMPTASATFFPFDKQVFNSHERLALGIDDNPTPSLSDLIAPDQASYNDYFWIISVREPDAQGIRSFDLVSKRPLLNGHYVYGGCGRLCSFKTLRVKEAIDEIRPQVSLRWMKLPGANLFLCSPSELATGCDPSPDVFDKVPAMLSFIERMFEAASIHPETR